LPFENYGQEVGGTNTLLVPNLKVEGPVSPGTTVVAPMPTMAEWPQLMEGSVVIFSEFFAQFTGLT